MMIIDDDSDEFCGSHMVVMIVIEMEVMVWMYTNLRLALAQFGLGIGQISEITVAMS
jgi:hypothetical protein